MSGAGARLPLMSLLTELSERVPGRAFGPGTTEYDDGRTVFYGPGEPEVVFRPTTADEVAAAVRAAVDANLPIAVRSGGHGSMPATGGAVIDLAEFDGIELLDGDLVRVGSGADEWNIQLVPLGNGRARVRDEARGLRSRPFELGDDDVFDVMLANNGFVNVLRGDYELWAKPYDGPTEGFAAGDDVRNIPVPTSLCERVRHSLG